MTGTCGSCKHWGAEEASRRPGFRACQLIPHTDDEPVTPNVVHVQDGEGYNAWLESTADFGCVLYEAVS